jgi:pyridoxine 5-phosphate synthase
MPKLGVNIDHVATLRQARREFDPDPVKAALICEEAGADSIVAHLREDRRHINEEDLKRLKKAIKTHLNCEMSIAPAIVEFVSDLKPKQITIVPERRQEITTEGGIDVIKYFRQIKRIADLYERKHIEVSLFIAPNKKQIEKTLETGARMIELHTGEYANAKTKSKLNFELQRIKDMTVYANKLGLIVNAGHGLKYDNTRAITQIKGMAELNIGHSIISRSIFVGLRQAVQEMKKIVHG